MRLQLKPPAAQECTYAECKDPAVGELRAHLLGHGPWPMCEQHIKPEAHPPDLRGQLVHWALTRGGA